MCKNIAQCGPYGRSIPPSEEPQRQRMQTGDSSQQEVFAGDSCSHVDVLLTPQRERAATEAS